MKEFLNISGKAVSISSVVVILTLFTVLGVSERSISKTGFVSVSRRQETKSELPLGII
jgi:hypothetical protein